MTLLDRHILSRFVPTLVRALLGCVGAYFLLNTFESGSRTTFAPTGSDPGNTWLFTLPFALLHMLPVACFLAGIGTSQGLARSGEWTSLQSSGWAPGRTIIAPLMLCVAVGALQFLIRDRWATQVLQFAHMEASPQGSPASDPVPSLEAGPNARSAPRSSLWFCLERCCYGLSQRRGQGPLASVEVLSFTENSLTGYTLGLNLVRAPSEGSDNRTWSAETQWNWTVAHDQAITGSVSHRSPLLLPLSQREVDLLTGDPEALTWEELLFLDTQLDARNLVIPGIRAAASLRMLLPVACVVLGLLGLALGLRFTGGRSLTGTLLEIGGFCLAYAFSLTGGVLLATSQGMPTWAVLWLPQLLWTLLGWRWIRHPVR